MKRAKDEMHSEYKRSDFTKLERGKILFGSSRRNFCRLVGTGDGPFQKQSMSTRGLTRIDWENNTHNSALNPDAQKSAHSLAVR